MKTTQEIIAPYRERLALIDYKKFKKTAESFSPTIQLFMQFSYRIPRGWYGFDLEGVPFIWSSIIRDFLNEVEKDCPNYEIHQIKLKYGMAKIHIQLNTKDNKKIEFINKQISELQKVLFSKDLIY